MLTRRGCRSCINGKSVGSPWTSTCVFCCVRRERKTHTILTYVSASGMVLPPMMVYPRKNKVPDNVREGCVPNALFVHSDTGWINANLFLEWFKFFINNIPRTRPVVLIQDNHSSHVSIELVELARENNIHLWSLPSHTSHILQPLDIGCFKSFKANFSKACHTYLLETWTSDHNKCNCITGTPSVA